MLKRVSSLHTSHHPTSPEALVQSLGTTNGAAATTLSPNSRCGRPLCAMRLLNAAEEGELNPSQRPTHIMRPSAASSAERSQPAEHGCMAWRTRHSSHTALAGLALPATHVARWLSCIFHIPPTPESLSWPLPKPSPSLGRASSPMWLHALGQGGIPLPHGIDLHPTAMHAKDLARDKGAPFALSSLGLGFAPSAILAAAFCLGSRHLTLSKSTAVLPATSPCWEPARPCSRPLASLMHSHRARCRLSPLALGLDECLRLCPGLGEKRMNDGLREEVQREELPGRGPKGAGDVPRALLCSDDSALPYALTEGWGIRLKPSRCLGHSIMCSSSSFPPLVPNLPCKPTPSLLRPGMALGPPSMEATPT